jgi:Leucine-rich repeat (LRR) protein
MKVVSRVLAILIFGELLFASCEKESARELNIPDNNFLNALLELGVDSNADGKISPDEAEGLTVLSLNDRNISDLTGIEAFVNLEFLSCSNNPNLTNLDLSDLFALKELICRQNQIAQLNISNDTALTNLDCCQNQLTSLDVSTNIKLRYIDCSVNRITTLDVSNNLDLIGLLCFINQLGSLDVTQNTKLSWLSCSENQLTSLDITNNNLLKEDLSCSNNLLTTLDVSNCPNIKWLRCNGNQITTLDVSNNTSITYLDCGENQLTDLDVSNNTAIVTMDIYGMPSLNQVCVWVMPFPPNDVFVNSTSSQNVHFTTDCTSNSR